MSISQPTGRADPMPKGATVKERYPILQRLGGMRARFASIVCASCGLDVEEKKKEEEKKPETVQPPKKEEAEKKPEEADLEKKKAA